MFNRPGSCLAAALCVVAALPTVLGPPTAAADTVAPPATAAAQDVTPTSPLRITASPTSQSDGSGRMFTPDAPYAVGGQLVTGPYVTRTASPLLYRRARLGGSGYTVPVSTPGTYFVDLFVAETQGAVPGQRVWDVTAEGRPVATDVDVVRDAGATTASHVLFATPVVDGELDIAFAPRAGLPLVGAVEVDYQSATTTPARTLFSDDFSSPAGTLPDSSGWTAVAGGDGWGNHELETYTKRASNASTDGAGNLAITARRETYTGPDGRTRSYTSARLVTRKTFTFQYGTAEARVRLPVGRGLWPAFWSLGANVGDVGWPRCGEIDVLENRGSEPAIAHATVHAADAAGLPWMSSTATTAAAPLSDGFHTYGMVWGPTAIAMTFDGRTFMSVSASDVPATDRWNFKHPFYLLLNLAVGGDWPGSPDATTAFPATMLVDYVRVTG